MGSTRSRTIITCCAIAIILMVLAYSIPISTKQEFVCITNGEAKPTRYSLIFGQKDNYDNASPPGLSVIQCIGQGVDAKLYIL